MQPHEMSAGSTLAGRALAALALGALNGAAGDRLAVERNPLAVPMQLRAGGHSVDVEAHALAEAYPRATGRIVVFLHGLGGNEDVWRLDPLGREVPGRLVARGPPIRCSRRPSITATLTERTTGRCYRTRTSRWRCATGCVRS